MGSLDRPRQIVSDLLNTGILHHYNPRCRTNGWNGLFKLTHGPTTSTIHPRNPSPFRYH
jgi:hypothetical protein